MIRKVIQPSLFGDEPSAELDVELPEEFVNLSIDRIEVYTDGASSPGGEGGWAWWCNEELHDSGNEIDTTNQRMELIAAFRAMQFFDQPVTIVSDSAYLVNCFNDKWYVKWRKTNWKKGKIKNRDIWESMLEVYESKPGLFAFRHVKGHSGVYGNEMADQLAVAAKLKLFMP
jgi:ribonuclease HI